MEPDPQTFFSLQAYINGHAARLLQYMGLYGQPVTQVRMCTFASMSDKTLKATLKRLEQLELVQHLGACTWALTPLARQYLAAVAGGPPCTCGAAPCPGRKNDDLIPPEIPDQPAPQPAGRKNSDLTPPEIPDQSADSPSSQPAGRKNSDLAPAAPPALRENRPDINELKDLKNLKNLKNTTAAGTLKIDSSSNNLNAPTPKNQTGSEPIAGNSVHPADQLTESELAAFLMPIFSLYDQHNPRPPFFAGHAYPARLDFLLRHAHAIERIRWPVDDFLDQRDQKEDTKTDHGAFKLLHLAGVRDLMPYNLARRYYCTTGYVRAMIAKALSQGDRAEPYLIKRIVNHEPPLALHPVSGHLMDCRCRACKEAMLTSCERCRCWPCTCGRYDPSGRLICF
jgi:hypothetical protein